MEVSMDAVDIMEHQSIRMMKQRALNYFLTELLKSEVENSVARIILFGSLLRDEIRKESDIDLLVVAVDSPYEVSKACADAAFETALATAESVEPLVRCIDQTRHPRSYFLYSILNHGQEVYRMNAEELKKKESQNYLELSSEYMDGARAASQSGHFRIAVDASYNACELLIKALLLMRLADIPGSHGGVVNKFGELFVKTGEVPKELGRAIGLALEKRNNARYEPHSEITKEHAEEIMGLAERLRQILEGKMGH